MGDAPKFMTVDEIASRWRVSNMTVYRLIESGDLHGIRIGRSYRIKESEVRNYEEEK